ncbi:tryptophanase-like [Ptychodera flava]|uniref:tryptophanase-like n=1 Tax=Ptychodera flava TaxID=63121 RepID=UPI00396A9A09
MADNGRKFPAIEPYRVKTVERTKITTRDERMKILEEVNFNVFAIKAEDIIIDLLTDSGTGAMSTEQWSMLMRGDESYAGSPSYYRFENAVKDIMGFSEVIPAHQGRGAEDVLFSTIMQPGDVAISNGFFDTTAAHVANNKGTGINIPVLTKEMYFKDGKFKGNMDTSQLIELLNDGSKTVRFVLITVTNNIGGGQPVSMANIREVSAICKKYNKPLYLDACRYAENSYFIKKYEPGYGNKTIKEIAREMFDLVDGCTMSAKKDGIANIGGFLCLRDNELATLCRQDLILKEGFHTYGGMSGREMETIAVGLYEALEESYLESRIGQTAYLGKLLADAGIRIIKPTGGHAVYFDSTSIVPHVPPLQYPGVAVTVAMYLEGGIRGLEMGSVFLAKQADGTEVPPKHELIRLAIPRRVYTKSHIEYIAAVIKYVKDNASTLPGFKITWEGNNPNLRHFTVKLKPLAPINSGKKHSRKTEDNNNMIKSV